jgi:hypothetical protein
VLIMPKACAPKEGQMAKAAQATKTKSIYGVHPGVAMTQKWIAQLKEKTGRTLEEWMRYIRKEGPPTEKDRRHWLKNELGLGTNTAWWLAERSVGKGEEVGDRAEYLKAAESTSKKCSAERRRTSGRFMTPC